MDVLDFQSSEKLLSDLRSYAGDIFSPKLVRKLQRKKIDGCWSDNMAWTTIEDIDQILLDRVCCYYSAIKGYHGCRPLSLEPYYQCGLKGQSSEEITKKFLELFSDVDSSALKAAINEMKDRGEREKGSIFFVTHYDDLIDWCGHYLIHGSEYLMALAVRLQQFAKGEQFSNRLKKVGIPTIIEVNIPLSHIGQSCLLELCREIIAHWGSRFLLNEESDLTNTSIVTHRTIDPKQIIRHFHPKWIRDPHSGFTTYVNQHESCPQCR